MVVKEHIKQYKELKSSLKELMSLWSDVSNLLFPNEFRSPVTTIDGKQFYLVSGCNEIRTKCDDDLDDCCHFSERLSVTQIDKLLEGFVDAAHDVLSQVTDDNHRILSCNRKIKILMAVLKNEYID